MRSVIINNIITKTRQIYVEQRWQYKKRLQRKFTCVTALIIEQEMRPFLTIILNKLSAKFQTVVKA